MVLATVHRFEPVRVLLSCRCALGGVLLSAFVPFQVTVRVNAPLPSASSSVLD